MSENKKLKKAARARQARTGEAYTTALAQVRDDDGAVFKKRPAGTRRIPMVRAVDDATAWTAEMPREAGRMVGFAWELPKRAYLVQYRSGLGAGLLRLTQKIIPLDGTGWFLSSPRFCPETEAAPGRIITADIVITRDDDDHQPVEDDAKLFALWSPGPNVPADLVWVMDGTVICPVGAQPVWGGTHGCENQRSFRRSIPPAIIIDSPTIPWAVYRLLRVWGVINKPLFGKVSAGNGAALTFNLQKTGNVSIERPFPLDAGERAMVANPTGPIIRAPNNVVFELNRRLEPGEYIGAVGQELADDLDALNVWGGRVLLPPPFNLTVNGHKLVLHDRTLSYDGLLDLAVLLAEGASGADAAREKLGKEPTVSVGPPISATMIRGTAPIYLCDGLVFNVADTSTA